MEKLKTSLQATLDFLEKNTKMDIATYQKIESAQVKILIQQFSETTCEIQEWSPLVDMVQSCAFLSESAKAELVTSMSTFIGKKKPVKRAIQSLQNGFVNYLSKQDREQLSNQDQHPFARLSVVVRRCMDIGLAFPCEQSMGHVVACVTEFFGLAEEPKDKHEILLEFKRQLKSARANFTEAVPIQEYPPEPRQLPETLRKQFYSDVVWSEMPAPVLARCKPGKWLRLSSKELTSRGSSQAKQPEMMGMQQMMQMQMQMFQAMLQGQQGNQDALENLQIFPQKKRKSFGSGQQTQQQGNQLALQDGNVRNDGGGEKPESSHQQQAVSEQDQKRNTAPAFSLPNLNDTKPEENSTVHDPQKHHEAMMQAMEERKAAREASKPKAKAKAKGKAKAKKAKSKFMAKPAAAASVLKPSAKSKTTSKAKSKAVPSSAGSCGGKKPSMIPPGGGTLFYKGGKIHRSDTSECWRVFRHKGDRCDLKVKWHGNPAVAWAKALATIDEASK